MNKSMLFGMSATFLLVVGAQHASSQETVVIDNLTYNIADGSATLVLGKASAEAPDVVIPERIPVGDSMVDVTRIGTRAFYSYPENAITSVDIPKTVVIIGSGAFCGCQNLKTVIFRGCPVLDDGVFWYDINYNRVLLDRIVCYSSVPPKCGSDCFSCFETYSPSYQEREVELQVPKGCAETYANSIAWYRFNVTEMEAEPFVPESYDVEETGLVSSDGVYYELRKSLDVAEAKVMPLHIPYMAEGIAYNYYIRQAELDIPEEVRLNDRLVFKVTEIADEAFCCSEEYYWNYFKTINIPGSVRRIGSFAFSGCRNLTTVNLSEGIKEIGNSAFSWCSIKELSLPASVEQIGDYVFSGCSSLTTVYCYAFTPPSCTENSFIPETRDAVVFYVPKGCREAYEASPGWNSVTIREIGDDTGISSPEYGPYRPFVEEGKVWVVKGHDLSADGSPMEPWIEYCYLDGDTIIGGQKCKQMKCIKNDNPSPLYIGAWYEQDKKVYFAGNNIEREDMAVYFAGDRPQFELLYDFTLSSGDNINLWDYMFVVKKMSGGITGFKGTYYDIRHNDIVIGRWFEGVGSESRPWNNHPEFLVGGRGVLLACVVGDDVIYYNSEEDDPYSMGARKRRFDFTHTIKTQPKARIKQEESDACINSSERDVARPKVKSRMRNGAEESMYGEYNDQQLCINLAPLGDTYLVCITDESGKPVYKKEINAGNIVGLNIDISNYSEGRYTVTVENSGESFTGEFDAGNADVDGDGILTAKDIIAIINVISGKATDEAIISAADVNGDGVVNVADIVEITNIMGQ